MRPPRHPRVCCHVVFPEDGLGCLTVSAIRDMLHGIDPRQASHRPAAVAHALEMLGKIAANLPDRPTPKVNLEYSANFQPGVYYAASVERIRDLATLGLDAGPSGIFGA